MEMNALIGSGFWAKDQGDFNHKEKFFNEVWLKRLFLRDIVIVDNSEAPVPKISGPPTVRVLPVMKNLGHVGNFIGQFRPHLLGWSMSWIIPAMVAYSEGRDFCYIEQDCLVFGDWENVILRDMQQKKMLATFGTAETPVARCEQSLFYIKHEFITEFIYKYFCFPNGDGSHLPESKFAEMADADYRVGRFSLQCGRMRPLPEGNTFYAQKITAEEMAELKDRKLI